MKLLRYGPPGQEKPALLDRDGRIRCLSGHVADIAPAVLTPDGLARLGALDPTKLPLVDGTPRLGVPVAGIGNIHAIGLNYRDHAAEAGLPVPTEPVLFSKATSCLCGAADGIIIPAGAVKTDWEVELAVIIGRRAHRVTEAEALAHVAGYAVMNDVSEREWQLEHGGQWVKGKSAENFGPLGPWLVTSDEVPDPQRLRLWLSVNEVRRQDGSTADMVFGVAALIRYLSHLMILLPGDVITTGTPAGVGLGHQPAPLFLAPGDRVELGIEGLGVQRHLVRAAAD